MPDKSGQTADHWKMCLHFCPLLPNLLDFDLFCFNSWSNSSDHLLGCPRINCEYNVKINAIVRRLDLIYLFESLMNCTHLNVLRSYHIAHIHIYCAKQFLSYFIGETSEGRRGDSKWRSNQLSSAPLALRWLLMVVVDIMVVTFDGDCIIYY